MSSGQAGQSASQMLPYMRTAYLREDERNSSTDGLASVEHRLFRNEEHLAAFPKSDRETRHTGQDTSVLKRLREREQCAKRCIA